MWGIIAAALFATLVFAVVVAPSAVGQDGVPSIAVPKDHLFPGVTNAAVTQANIEREKNQKFEHIAVETQKEIRAYEDRMRWLSILIPPIRSFYKAWLVSWFKSRFKLQGFSAPGRTQVIDSHIVDSRSEEL